MVAGLEGIGESDEEDKDLSEGEEAELLGELEVCGKEGLNELIVGCTIPSPSSPNHHEGLQSCEVEYLCFNYILMLLP